MAREVGEKIEEGGKEDEFKHRIASIVFWRLVGYRSGNVVHISISTKCGENIGFNKNHPCITHAT